MILIVFPIRYINKLSYQLKTLNVLYSSRLKLSFGRTKSLINFNLLLIENGTAKTNGIYLFERLLFEVSRGGMGVIFLVRIKIVMVRSQ